MSQTGVLRFVKMIKFSLADIFLSVMSVFN